MHSNSSAQKQRRHFSVDQSAFWNILGSGMMSANTVIMNMLVGHLFDLAEVGIFSLSLTTAQILYVIALFGASDLQMTDKEGRHPFSDYFGLKLFSSALAVICCLIYLLIRGSIGTDTSRVSVYTALLTLFMLINSYAELFQSLYFQHGRLDLTGKSLFWRYFVSTLIFALAVLLRRDVVSACVAMTAGDLIMTVIWCKRYAGAYRDSGYQVSWEGVRSLLSESLPLCLSVLGNLVLLNCAKYLIEAYCSSQIQGVYTILFMPVYAMNLLAQFIFKPLLYEYMEILGNGRKHLKTSEKRTSFSKAFFRHAGAILLLTIICAAILYLIGVPVLRFFFGQDLSEWRIHLFFFTLSGGLLAINQLLYYILVIMKAQNFILFNYLPAIAVSVLTGFLWIGNWSIWGALWSFAIGEGMLLAGYAVYLMRFFRQEKEGSGR